jgi:hypothetical protein
MKKLKLLPAVIFLTLLLTPLGSAREPIEGYYESSRLTYFVRSDRSLEVQANFSLVNQSTRMRITGVSWPAYGEVENVRAWDGLGDLEVELEAVSGGTVIKIDFRGDGILPGDGLEYGISYETTGVVQGSGPEYKVSLGGLQAGDFPHENYVITVEAENGLSLFLVDQPVEVLRKDPMRVEYKTSIEKNESFDGLRLTFYSEPAFFKVNLLETVTNQGQEEAKDLKIEMALINRTPWQFSAVASSNFPIETMFLDEENNWYGLFEVGDLQPNQSKILEVGLVYINEIYDPEINENTVGSIDSTPLGLSEYLKADNYWEVDHPSIKNKALEIRGTENNAYRVAERIMQFVGENIEYEITENRQGALQSLIKRRGDCDCFSDLTIALARAAGILSKFSSGWIYDENRVGNLGPHAWVEFYFPNEGWQPADPTWAKNSGDYLGRLDPIHLLRSNHGLSSSECKIWLYYSGGNITIEESWNSDILSAQEAGEELVNAAESSVTIAEQLSKENETFKETLDLARLHLDQAKTKTGIERIQCARLSILESSKVIQALGVPFEPEEPVRWEVVTALGIILILTIGATIIYSVRKKSPKKFK